MKKKKKKKTRNGRGQGSGFARDLTSPFTYSLLSKAMAAMVTKLDDAASMMMMKKARESIQKRDEMHIYVNILWDKQILIAA